jgi:hypothetical protein
MVAKRSVSVRKLPEIFCLGFAITMSYSATSATSLPFRHSSNGIRRNRISSYLALVIFRGLVVSRKRDNQSF